MEHTLSTESLRGKRRWLIVEDASASLEVIGCYEVSARREHYLAECVIRAGNGRYVVSVEDAPRYERTR